MLRHSFLMRRVWQHWAEMIFWALTHVVLWGFMSSFFHQYALRGGVQTHVLLAAALLWVVVYRAGTTVTNMFLHEIYANSLGHLLTTPMRNLELAVVLCLTSALMSLLIFFVACVLAWSLFGFWLFQLGWPLIPIVLNLLWMGWTMGFVFCALIIRFGLSIIGVAWLLPQLAFTAGAVVYPLRVLPTRIHWLVQLNPATYIFEEMRAVMQQGVLIEHAMLWASGLNMLYSFIALALFFRAFYSARVRGTLLHVGE